MSKTITTIGNKIQSNLLEISGNNIENFLLNDHQSTLINQIGLNAHSQNHALVSGLTDMDYPEVPALSSDCANVNQLKMVNKVPIPPEITEHFNNIQCHCMMGLFTEINRAWLTIDSDIYVWNYEHGSDVAYFDGINETIVSVGLVKPKPNVFQKRIKYLLVLTTTIEIFVLGVTFSGSLLSSSDVIAQEEMHLVPEPIFVLSTDGIACNVIAGTDLGRIFLGGIDGSLFEIVYQLERPWFGKRCQKVNHSISVLSYFVPAIVNSAFAQDDAILKISVDNSRSILYTLTVKGLIEVYDLGKDANTISRVARVHQTSIIQNVLNIIKTLDISNFKQIVNISAIEMSESNVINLVAITETAIRLYFTCYNLNTTAQFNQEQRPTRLLLIHIRLPPGYAANAPNLRPRNISSDAIYRINSLIMLSQADQNYLWCISDDPFTNLNSFQEAYTVLPLNDSVWAIDEVIIPSPFGSDIFSNQSSTDGCAPPSSSAIINKRSTLQHAQPPRKYVVLMSQGALIITKHRPVDLLRNLLIETNGMIESDKVKAFFLTMQNTDEACATCLILACSLDSVDNNNLIYWATRAFFFYGGQAKLIHARNEGRAITGQSIINQQLPENTTIHNITRSFCAGLNPNLVSTPTAPRQQQRSMNESNLNGTMLMMSPSSFVQSPNQVFASTVQSPPQIILSSKHNGLYMFVSRILRPIWHLTCAKKVYEKNNEYIVNTISVDDCRWLLSYLTPLRNFLDQNLTSFINQPPVAATTTNMQHNIQQTINQDNALNDVMMLRNNNDTTQQQLEERQSLEALKHFVTYTCEVIGFWQILCQHQFHQIIQNLNVDQQNALSQCRFSEILTNRQPNIISYLISHLITAYLNDNASIDSISSKLRSVCPTIYRNEDAACSKANEMLLMAKSKDAPHERNELLHEALNLCKDIAPNLNLSSICQKFIANQFYLGVLELCYVCAKQLDDKNLGYYYYKSNQPSEDLDGAYFYTKRLEFYKQITTMLDQLYDQTQQNQNTQTNYPDNQVKEIIMSALRYKDELLHVCIYEWLLVNNLHSELISINEPSLEEFLIRTTRQPTRHQVIEVYDLLWKYYEKNGNHPAAAHILNQLATEQGNSLNLTQRIEYLAHSVICMRGDRVGCAAPLGIFLRELEDRIQIARVQQKILNAIKVKFNDDLRSQDAIRELNSKLFTITELYENFAEPFNLWECKLSIMYCSGHEDPALIENIWENIIISTLRQAKNAHPSSAQDQMVQLLKHIEVLAKEYSDNDSCFPLRIIVNLLEIECCKLGVSPTMVPQALISMNIPLGKLIHTYKSLLKERISGHIGNQYHMYEAVVSLITCIAQNLNRVSNIERIMFANSAQELISSALTSLYCKKDTKQLIEQFRIIQKKLETISSTLNN